jgi:hypothetical protein
MLKKITFVVLLLAVCTFAGCSSDEDPNEAAESLKGAPAPVMADPNVSYASGFYGLEGAGDASFRWMMQEGVVKLRNLQKEMRLHIKGGVQIAHLPKATLTISLNGQPLGQIPAAAEIDKEYSVSVSQQGTGPTSDLSIKIDKVFVPKDVDPKTTDDRQLGFALNKLEWVAK